MADETYHPSRLSHPPQPNPPLDWGDIWRVTEVPTSDLGRDGDFAGNIITGDVYFRSNGAWMLYTGGGGGGGTVEVSVGTVEPEGVVTKTAPHIYINTLLKTLWVKESGSGNTGWVQYI